MTKKLYSLVSIFLLLASCATEETETHRNSKPTDGSNGRLFLFSVDARMLLRLQSESGM